MKKSLFVVLMLSAFALFSTPQQAVAETYQSSAGNYRWGGVFNMPGSIRQSPNEITLVDASVGFDIEAVIGCNGIDLKRAFESIINIDVDEIIDAITNYFQQGLAQYLLTQVYSSPALAAIFDSLEAFGNARVAMMQQKCNVAEARAQGRENIANARAEALQQCLSANSGDESECFKNGSDGIRDQLAAMSGWIEKSGSLYDVLGDDLGDLKMFIPDFKFCVAADRTCDMPQQRSEAQLTAAEMAQAGRTNTQAGVGTFMEMITSLDSSAGRGVVDQRLERVASRDGGWGYEDAPLMIADVEERSFENPFISNIQLGVTDFASGPEDAENQYPPEFTAMRNAFLSQIHTDEDRKFVNFINCRSTDFGLDTARALAAAFPGVRVDPYILSPNFDAAQFPALATAGDTYFDVLAGNMWTDISEDLGAFNLLGIATSCVYNHHMAVAPKDLVRLSRMPQTQRQQIVAAISDRAATLSVETVLRFMKHMLLDSYASGSFTNAQLGEDEVAPIPPHVIEAIKLVVEDIENRIQTLRSIAEAQKEFGAMMADFLRNFEENAEKFHQNGTAQNPTSF